MSALLCIDIGNSRLKYACYQRETLATATPKARLFGALSHHDDPELTQLAARLAPCLAWDIVGVALVSVVNETLNERLAQRLAEINIDSPIQRIRASARQGRLVNHYHDPAQLGADRWCALVAASRLHPTTHNLVVNAGTATTIDRCDGERGFVGGLIVPAAELMIKSLNQHTARLPLAQGHYQNEPRCTADAMTTGAIEATLGAIDRAWARLPQPRTALCSGGNRQPLLARSSLPWVEVDDLVNLGAAWCLDSVIDS